MRNRFVLAAAMAVAAIGARAQSTFWTKTSESLSGNKITNAHITTGAPQLFALDLSALTNELAKASSRESSRKAELIINFPTPQGKLERFSVIEASVMHPGLAAKYPGIKSYAGQGIDDPTASIRFSLDNGAGFHGMILSGTKNAYYIDPYSTDKRSYTVYSREDMGALLNDFQCFTESAARPAEENVNSSSRSNDKKLKRYRLALSCNAEYGNIFAGTGTDTQKKANILAQMNITITRVNSIFEKDLAITLQLVPNNDLLIFFGSTSADPWSGEFNGKTQEINDATIGNANYDIGHNFNTEGGGSAGCIGCVCTTGSKGSGYTGRSDPTGDAFDIDYVAHEIGHQFGGFHTQASFNCISGSGTSEVEPGSGSTIMGYAGICVPNVQSNSDAYFHYVNIRDISQNIQTGPSSGCAQIVNIINKPPTANAGPDYTIPKSTAFVLKGSGSDQDDDPLIYTWEQNDPQNEFTATINTPSPTQTAGPVFRSRPGTSSPNRFMPQLSDVLNNTLTPTWEVIPSVARTLNFALTVRDNKAGGGQTSDDLMVVTVNGTAGPFTVNTPNTPAIVWGIGSSRTVTWNVAGTNVAPVGCASVNILLSTDGGLTYPVTLANNTPNDGSQIITVPNSASMTCRVKIEAADNIFYDISNTNFTIGTPIPCTPVVPIRLLASNITASAVTLNWIAISGAVYEIQYRVAGTTAFTGVNVDENLLSLSGLTPSTHYELQARSVCPLGGNSAFSALLEFTTPEPPRAYCLSNGASVEDEFIEGVQLGTISNTSGSNGGYANFTALSTDLVKGILNTFTITPGWNSNIYNEGYAIWIDYNKDGDFDDSGEQIFSKSPSQTTLVIGTFIVPATALSGSTRMRVSMKYDGIPTFCETFDFGEVEDYTVNITGDALPCIAANQLTLSATQSTVCQGTSTTLSIAPGNLNHDVQWKWYKESCGGSSIGSGNHLAVSPVVTTTYYVRQDGCNQVTNSCSSIIITVNSVPAITLVPAARCGPGSVTLGASTSVGTINWFSSATGGPALVSATSFITPVLSTTTSYYAEATHNECTSTRLSINATIISIPIVGATPVARCGPGSVTLQASASGGTVSWFTNVSGGSALSTGTSFITPSLSTSTSYYLQATDNGCTSPRSAVSATIKAKPVITSTTPGTRCGTGTLTLSAATDIGTITWYSQNTGGNALLTGANFSTPSLTSTTTYYVQSTGNGCTSERSSIVATVNTPTITSTKPAQRCNAGDVKLQASTDAQIIRWYDQTGLLVSSGNSLEIINLSQTTTYFAEAAIDDCVSSKVSVIATIVTTPILTSVLHGERCGAGIVTLKATASNGEVKWYNDEIEVTAVGTGNIFAPAITSSKTYYAQAAEAMCSTLRTPVMAIIKPKPEVTVVQTGNHLNVTGTPESGTTFQWIACHNGNRSVIGATNTDFQIVANGQYAVTATQNECSTTSACINVLFTDTEDAVQHPFSIHPNPHQGNFLIDFGTHSFTHLIIRDMSGKIVYQENSRLTGLKPLNLTVESGFYFIEATDKKENYRIKMSVVR